jgi:hypothetical protein
LKIDAKLPHQTKHFGKLNNFYACLRNISRCCWSLDSSAEASVSSLRPLVMVEVSMRPLPRLTVGLLGAVARSAKRCDTEALLFSSSWFLKEKIEFQ